MVAMASMSMAQGKKGGDFDPADRAEKRAEKLKVELNLDDQQTTQVEAALLTKLTQTKEIRVKHATDKVAMRGAMKPVNEAFRKSMKSILTEEQVEKWKEVKQDKRKEIRAEGLKDELDLTDDQVEEIEAAMEVRKEKTKTLRAKHSENKEELKKEMKSANEEFRVTVKEILNDEQWAKWEEMRKEKAGKAEKRGAKGKARK